MKQADLKDVSEESFPWDRAREEGTGNQVQGEPEAGVV